MERPSGETTAGCRGDGAGVAAGSRGRVERVRSPRAPASGAGAAASKRETASARALDRVRSRDAILSFSLSALLREEKKGKGDQGRVVVQIGRASCRERVYVLV